MMIQVLPGDFLLEKLGFIGVSFVNFRGSIISGVFGMEKSGKI
jgi:hypothetical protein